MQSQTSRAKATLPDHLAGPIVPPSMNSALGEVWRRSDFPRSTFVAAQRLMRGTTVLLSQRMWLTLGENQMKFGSSAVQIREISCGIRNPLLAQCAESSGTCFQAAMEALHVLLSVGEVMAAGGSVSAAGFHFGLFP